MSESTVDFTMRIDRTGNMVIGKRGEYVVNIVNMLFNMRPGTDPYNPNRGLYIASKFNKPHTKNMRDTSYEAEITKQFTTYTDLIPITVIAVYMNKSLHIYMTIKYQNEIYEMNLEHANDTLSAVLREQS